MTKRTVLLLAGGVAAAIAAVGVVALLAGDDERSAPPAARRPAEAVTGAVLRPASSAGVTPVDGRSGDLSWRSEVGEVVVMRDGRTILRADDAVRFQDSAMTARDLDGDGRDELVAMFRGQGSAGLLEVDVVSPDGDVVFHHEADKGVVVVGGEEVEIFAARFGPADPNCCPSAYERRVIEGRGGRWAARVTGEVPAEEVPASAI